MDNFQMGGHALKDYEIDRFDPRIKAAMKGWQITTVHNKETIRIPGDWNSPIYPYKYAEIYKKEGDVNGGEQGNEIQCYLSCGWEGCDDEVVIVLGIYGKDVLNNGPVTAEIHKFTSNPIKVFRINKLVTDFTKKFLWFFTRGINKDYWKA